MRKEIHIALRKTPKTSLPHVWADLFMNIKTEHSYGMPADLTEEERTEIMNKIREEVGMKACWREFLKRSGWTDQLFEDWWASTTEEKSLNAIYEISNEQRNNSHKEIVEEIRKSFFFLTGCFLGHVIFDVIVRLLEIS